MKFKMPTIIENNSWFVGIVLISVLLKVIFLARMFTLFLSNPPLPMVLAAKCLIKNPTKKLPIPIYYQNYQIRGIRPVEDRPFPS